MYRHLFLFFFYVQVNHVKMGRKHSQIYYQEGSTFRDNDDNNKKKIYVESTLQNRKRLSK